MAKQQNLDFDTGIAKFQPRQLTACDVFDSGKKKFLLYGGALGGGKILSDSAHLLTPFGWKMGKDIKVGDTICNPDGTHQKIIQIKPRVTLPAWHLTFHDGSKITVAEDHLWQAWRSGRTHKKENKRMHGQDCTKVVDTKTLCEWLDRAKEIELFDFGQSPWPLIPVCEEQHFNVTLRYKSWLPPYLLGVLLGDGCISTVSSSITCHTDDLSNLEFEFKKTNLEYSLDKKDNKVVLRFIGKTRKDIVEELIRLKLLGTKSDTKFIPREFLFSSINARYALLQGLMDTDGTISDGRISYCSTSKTLTKDVRHLIRSLGGIATMTDKKPWYYDDNKERVYCKDAYNLYIKHREPEKLFKLLRKKEKAKLKRETPMYLRLVDYKVTGKVIGRCITVDNPNGLYITDDFIVTHNSYFLRWFGPRFLMKVFLEKGLTWVNVMLACENYPSLKDRQLQKISREFPDWMGKNYADHRDYGRCFILAPEYGNGVISFRNLDDPAKYASSEFAAILVDELTKNAYEVFTFLRTRLRWPGLKDLECPFLGGTNPGSIGHGWVKALWMDKIFGDEWKPSFENPVDYREQFAYIPSKADDNKFLDATYWAVLNTLPEALRKAFRDGDWNVFIGQAFQEWSEPVHVVDEEFAKQPIPENAPIIMTYDWGFGAPFSIGWWWVDNDDRIFRFDEWYGWNGTPNQGLRMTDTDIANGIIAKEKSMGIWGRVSIRLAGSDCFQKRPNYMGGGQGPSTAEIFRGKGLHLRPGDDRSRITKIKQMHERLRHDIDRPMMQIYPNCRQFIRTIPNLIVDENNIEDIEMKGETHCLDDSCHIIMSRPIGKIEVQQEVKRPPKDITEVAQMERKEIFESFEIEKEGEYAYW